MRRLILGFSDFPKVEVVQLTSDSYDQFQQETFNLLMRLKRSDKQQRYHHGMGTSIAGCQTSTQCHTPRCRPHHSRCHRHLHKYHKDIHSRSIYNIHSSTSNRHLHSHMHWCNSRSRATAKHAVTAAHSTAAASHTPSTAAPGHTPSTAAADYTSSTAAAHTTATTSSTN